MSQSYYKPEKGTEIGSIIIGEKVFEKITEDAIEKCEGIELDETSYDKMTGKDGIEIDIKNNQVIINAGVNVDYGISVSKTISSLQNSIAEEVKNTVGTNCIKVNINVNAINF